jgi:hypothetical protein
MLLDDTSGAVPRAQAAWTGAGLPDSGAVCVEQLQRARARLRGE